MSLSSWDQPSGTYIGTIPPGTAAFRKVIAEFFGYSRTEVVRDRSRCAGQRSEHCECGAVDAFTTDLIKGRILFHWCVANSDDLGIQSVIFNRRVIGFGDPDERVYHGPSPHTDHVHIGLNRWARKNLTEAMVREKLPGAEEDFLAKLTEDEQQELLEKVRRIDTALIEKDDAKVKAVTGRSTGSVMSGIWKLLKP